MLWSHLTSGALFQRSQIRAGWANDGKPYNRSKSAAITAAGAAQILHRLAHFGRLVLTQFFCSLVAANGHVPVHFWPVRGFLQFHRLRVQRSRPSLAICVSPTAGGLKLAPLFRKRTKPRVHRRRMAWSSRPTVARGSGAENVKYFPNSPPVGCNQRTSKCLVCPLLKSPLIGALRCAAANQRRVIRLLH